MCLRERDLEREREREREQRSADNFGAIIRKIIDWARKK